MSISPTRFSALLASLTLAAAQPASAEPAPPADQTAWAEQCSDWDEWDKAGPPFQIFGNAYYVGTCGISSILITGEEGHVLIDGGTEGGAADIAQNMRELGFQLSDVKLLLHTHEHFDHVGGTAELQRLTGARLIASPAAAPVLASGVTADVDPQAGSHEPFPAARVDAILGDEGLVQLGELRLQAIPTPGHTAGALSWQWQSCEGETCRTLVYADSLSPVSTETYRFSDHPEALEKYRASIARLAALDCDILLAPHPSAAGMRSKLLGAVPLADPESCRTYAKGVGEKLDERLAAEAKQAK